MSELEATLPLPADVSAPALKRPTLADHIAAIDAVAVAARIAATQSTRAAIGASAAEIIAMAQRLMQLTRLADLTFEMLTTANAAEDEKQPDQKRRLQQAVRLKIDDVGAALEALGYRSEQQPASSSTGEHDDGTRIRQD